MTENQQDAANERNNEKQELSFKELYFSSKGRIGQKKYLLSALKLTAFMLLFFVLSFYLALVEGVVWLLWLTFIFFLLSNYMGLMLGIKRCHDFDKSGWYLWKTIFIIPGLKLLFCDGNAGPNKYGPDPLKK